MYTYEYSEGTHISLHFKNNVHLKKKNVLRGKVRIKRSEKK